MWLDEAQTAAIADRPFGDVFDALRVDGAPPLYYVLLHGWIQLFGASDAAVRALSSLFSLLALPVGYVVGTRLGAHGATACCSCSSSPRTRGWSDMRSRRGRTHWCSCSPCSRPARRACSWTDAGVAAPESPWERSPSRRRRCC
jgi:hypothetical protein